MIRKLFSLFVLALVISSCGNTGKKEASATAEGSEAAVKVEFASLVANPESYIDKNMIIEGKVVHVCRTYRQENVHCR